MSTVQCDIVNCQSEFPDNPFSRKQHAVDVHGFPTCRSCSRTFQRFDSFLQHVKNATCVASEAYKRELAQAGFPKCPRCAQDFKRGDLFLNHVNKGTCVASEAFKSELAEAGFPTCPCCSQEFQRGDLFLNHVKSATCVATEAFNQRLTEAGFPVCPKCSQEFQRGDNFLKHVAINDCTEPCGFTGCSARIVKSQKNEHAATHGFPTCTTCPDKPTFKRVEWFYLHMKNHTEHKFDKCAMSSCMVQVTEGHEVQHATECHGFPTCATCDEEFARLNHFYAHVERQSCEATVSQECPYPDCEGTVYPNRAELTKQHLADAHDGFTCQKCKKQHTSNTTIAMFLKHVQRCYQPPGVQCDGCTFVAQSEAEMEQHICVPADAADSFGGYQNVLAVYQNPSVATAVRITTQQSPSRTSLCRINESTLQYNSFARDVAENEKIKSHRTKFHDDPTCSELVSLHDLPVIALFLPREETFESKMRILHELETCPDDNDWQLWCILVNRIYSLACDLKYGADYRELQRVLDQVELPPGVDPKFRDLHMINSHVNFIKLRAQKHTDVQIMYESSSGERPLKRYMRRLNIAREHPQFQFHRNEVATVTSAAPVCTTTERSAKEARWDDLVCNFYRDVLMPIMHSRTFSRLRSLDHIQLNFFGDNNLMLTNHRATQERLRPKELKQLPTDPNVLRCYRDSQKIQQHRLREHDAAVEGGNWCTDRELSTNGSVPLKRDESVFVHQRVRQLVHANAEMRRLTPLHPRRTPAEGAIPFVAGGAAASSSLSTPPPAPPLSTAPKRFRTLDYLRGLASSSS